MSNNLKAAVSATHVKGLRRLIWVLNFVTVSFGGIGAAYADVVVLPSATVSGNSTACTTGGGCTNVQITDFTPGIVVGSANTSGPSAAAGTNSTIGYLGPSISLMGSGNVNAEAGSGSVFGTATIQYFFEIVGPGPFETVGVNAALGTLFTNSGGANTNADYATLTFFSTLNSATILNAAANSANPLGPPGPPSQIVSQTIIFPTNTLIRAVLQAQINAGGVGIFSISASVDPTLTLADPSLYTLLFSPGIENGSGVAVTPIPSTWTMMLIGLCGFGFVAYRRKSGSVRFA
jgi:hypothetical protein